MGTVGAVAVDGEGNVACATSTGGLLNKMEGRVGDTPCIGLSEEPADWWLGLDTFDSHETCK